ncbi:DUF262 domain-containing protein [Vallitalea guaymasensis]|uniref:DUF262 domain-containing protein n=1 Tax=Vallitalea guaymasensis TaxID=1185412 RepID=A0A8J8SCK7_9FIRM|nr:DUF262 domain-containing protein [Vallitalea guaymasensis]QUH29784.1 DUF262 domain-containing protein [Vallitalea guaymasensis]
MKADSIKLLEFIGQNKRTFSIPVYQRNYDWKKNQCIRLFHDVEDLVNKDTHFLGTIVYTNGESTAIFREFIVIDGQQRLTSTMLLLKALNSVSKDISFRQEIYEDYLTNKRAPEKFRMKLKPVESDRLIYKNIIEDGLFESSSNVNNNYQLFLSLVQNSSYTPNELFLALNKLEVVYIQLESGKENPQLIFESLNSTGLNLTQADLIRNYLLMDHTYSLQVEYYNKYWIKIEEKLPNAILSDFIRDYLTLKTATIPKKEKVYDSFKTYFSKISNYNSKSILEDLLVYSKYYSWLYYHNSKNEELNGKLREIKRLKSTVTYPFLLYLLEDCYEYNKLSETELIKILSMIISYIYRRIVCEVPTNALNKVFSRMHKDLARVWNDELSYYNNIAILLLKKQSSSLFPKDEHFKQALLTRDIYNFKQKKYTLEKLETYNNKETVSFDNLTIEHIMPQTLSAVWKIDLGNNFEQIHSKYLHLIGNLTLSGYSGDLSNKDFKEKQQKLMESNISINRMLNQYDIWSSNEIEDRGNRLFDIAKKVWDIPDINKNLISLDPNTLANEFDIGDDVNVKGRKPYELTVIGERNTISSWREFFITICNKCFEYDSELFIKLLNHNDFTGRSRNIISDKSDTMNRSYKIADNIYIELKLSANDVLNYSKLLVEKFEDLETEVSYKIR